MFRARAPFAIGLIAISLSAWVPIDAAEPEANSLALRTALKALLTAPWEKTPDGPSLADKHHNAAKQAAPGDPRVDFSLALVQLRYLKYTDAERTLDQLGRAAPDYLPATEMKIYLTVLMKKHAAALAQMEELQRRIAERKPDASPSAAPDASRRDAIEFLARLYAYYEGPAAGLVSQATVADMRRGFLESLGTTDRDLFSAAFGGVADRFSQLDDDKRRTAEETKASEERQKALDLQRLEAEKSGVAAGKQALQQQAAEAQKIAQDQIDKLDQQMIPLDAEYARINAAGQLLRNRIAQFDRSISGLLSAANNEKDPDDKAELLAEAEALTFQVRRIEFDYQALDAQAAQVVAQKNGLLQQRGRAIAQYEADAKRLGVEAAKLGRNEKRIVVEQKQALKPATGISPRVQGKVVATASITSYVDFPLERERMRILRSLE